MIKERIVRRGNVYMVGVFGLLSLALVCLTALLAMGKDATTYLLVVSPIITTLLSLFVISKQVDDVRHVAEKVEHQTNGALADQFNDLKDHIDSAVAPNE